jgi:hypothetical protein
MICIEITSKSRYEIFQNKRLLGDQHWWLVGWAGQLYLHGLWADHHSFHVFPFVKGIQDGIGDTKGIILTQSLAKKIFGEKDPFGQTITYGNNAEHFVAGVILDPPGNSSLQFSFITNILSNARFKEQLQQKESMHEIIIPGCAVRQRALYLPVLHRGVNCVATRRCELHEPCRRKIHHTGTGGWVKKSSRCSEGSTHATIPNLIKFSPGVLLMNLEVENKCIFLQCQLVPFLTYIRKGLRGNSGANPEQFPLL